MEIMHPRCAGLDVHKDMVMARVRCVSDPPVDETRSFATTTAALMELQEWLSSHGVSHVLIGGAKAQTEFLRGEPLVKVG